MSPQDTADSFPYHRVRFMYTTNRTWRRIAIVVSLLLCSLIAVLITLLLWYFLFRSSPDDAQQSSSSSSSPDGRPPSDGCFPASATALTRTGSKRMDELELGERVLDLDQWGRCCRWTRVYAWAYRDDQWRSVIRLQLAPNRTLTLTATHLVFRISPGLEDVPADAIGPGDVLLGQDGRWNVTSARWTVARGAYAPLTQSGTVLVDGVWVSCYAGRWLGGALGHQFLHIAGTGPLRTLAALMDPLLDGDGKQWLFAPDQYHLWYVKWLKLLDSFQ